MTRTGLSPAAAQYLHQVELLLDDVEKDDRVDLLTDLADQLVDLPDREIIQRLGSPDRFATEYRMSAGLTPTQPTPHEGKLRAPVEGPVSISMVLSLLVLPIGILGLFSFGAQIIFGPFLLAIEWILARISPQPLRIVWVLLGGALGGEIAYLFLDLKVRQIEGYPAIVVGIVAASVVALLIERTTRTHP
jgi:uncharacterized membrane protein